MVGTGWCRPEGCDPRDTDCRVNGYFKDKVDSDECRLACLNETSCSGFGTSSEGHSSFPNRCYVHGNISTSERFSEWQVFRQQHYIPTKSSGDINTFCWRRKGKKNHKSAFILYICSIYYQQINKPKSYQLYQIILFLDTNEKNWNETEANKTKLIDTMGQDQGTMIGLIIFITGVVILILGILTLIIISRII